MTDRDTSPIGPDMRLADRLWARTETLHRQAERSGVLQDLLRGRASPRDYALLLRNLLPVYEALERGLDDLPAAGAVARLARPEVYRAAALRADLAHLDGAGLRLLDSGRRYAERIEAAGRDGGMLLVAHAYVRYLGDLNGGQILKRLLAKHLGLGPDGLSFYDFPGDPAALAHDYRAAIDAAGALIDDPDPVLDEACAAFRLNIALSEAVQADAAQIAPAAVPVGTDIS